MLFRSKDAQAPLDKHEAGCPGYRLLQQLRKYRHVAQGLHEVWLLPRPAGIDPRDQRVKETKMDELYERIKKIIADKLEVEEDKISLDASFRQDLGADSLDTYELVYGIEEELKIRIPDEKANEFETVRDAYEFIKSQM